MKEAFLLCTDLLKKFLLPSIFLSLMLISACGGGGGGGGSTPGADTNPVYTVIFDSQGASVNSNPALITVTLPATTVEVLPTPPVKTGFSFAGWFTAVNGGGTEFTAVTPVTGNITVYASWVSGTVLADNYSKIATAYANAISSATISSSDTSNLYHVTTTLHNAGSSVSLVTSVFMNCSSDIQGVQGTYTFNNYIDGNGVVLNGTLDYYTTGASATVFIIQGTITASGSANGAYIYKVKSDSGTLSGYAGITGYYYNYSTSSSTTVEPSVSFPDKPVIVYCGQDAPDEPGTPDVIGGNEQLELSWTGVSGATAYEVWYSETSNSLTATQQGGDIAATNFTLTGLSNGTQYYIWLKAKSSAGTSGFGVGTSGTPIAIATITTTSITDIGKNHAASGGNVINEGTSVTERGICWSTDLNPTTNDSKTSNGTGTGSFKSSLTGLADNTIYYVRAYAINSEGTSYGDQMEFTTSSVYKLRDSGPAGGLIFYDDEADGIDDIVGFRYLEAAPYDQSVSEKWSNVTGTSIGGTAQGKTIGKGMANTVAITSQAGHTGSAAKLCEDLIIGSFSGWFLPSIDELILMQNCLKLAGVGGFAANTYWSSTEHVSPYADHAWRVYFGDAGIDSFDLKSTLLFVRAVRAFND